MTGPESPDGTPATPLSALEALRLASLLATTFKPHAIACIQAESVCTAFASLEITAYDFAAAPSLSEATLFFWLKQNGGDDEALIRELSAKALNDSPLVIAFSRSLTAAERAAFIQTLLHAGLWPDYKPDLSRAPLEALVFGKTPPPVVSSELIRQMDESLLRTAERTRELEHVIHIQREQLENAQIALLELTEKKNKFRDKWQEARDKLARARGELDRWEKTAVGFFGRRLRARREKLSALTFPSQNRDAQVFPGQAQATDDLTVQPLISLIVLVKDPNGAKLPSLVDSVRTGVYPHWKLYLVNISPDVSDSLCQLAKRDARITLIQLRSALDVSAKLIELALPADSEWIALIDECGILEPSALFEIARQIQLSPTAEIIYTDHDQVGPDGERLSPFFKPDWSPETFLSINFLQGLTLLRRSLFIETGGLREEYGSATLYDLFLRATELTRNICHVPKLLWHESTDSASVSCPDDIMAALRAALVRRHIDGEVHATANTFSFRIKRKVSPARKITIIIPTRDKLGLLRRCVSSITEKTDYPNYQIVLVDNDSELPETHRYYHSLPHRVLHYGGPFNYSAINNYAVANTDGDWILFLNNDIEVLDPEWLSNMAGLIQDEEIGAVGAKLLYPDDTIQHAGVVIGCLGGAAHAFKGLPADAPGTWGQAQMIRNYSAVTAACLLTRREVWNRVGGFDEINLPVSLNDIDWCLRARACGYRVVYTPYARLRHYESASRGARFDANLEVKYFKARWAPVFGHDPYYNPNLSSENPFNP